MGLSRPDAQAAIEACSLLTDAFFKPKRERLADHLDELEFRDGDTMNQTGAGWAEFDDSIDPGTSLLIPRPGGVIRATLHPTHGDGIYTPKEINVGAEGTGVFGWGSGVAHGHAALTEKAVRIDHEPVFRMDSVSRQKLLGVSSLASLIKILELTDPEVAKALKAINRRLEQHLAFTNHLVSQLDPSFIIGAPNLSKAEVNAIPRLSSRATHAELSEGTDIQAGTAKLQILGKGASGHYFDQSGRALARVETDPNGEEWHLLFPSRTIRIDAGIGTGSDVHFVSDSNKGVHITSVVSVEEPAVIATMNQALALSGANTARATWDLEAKS